jgi:serine/threonine-protein kinase HipA
MLHEPGGYRLSPAYDLLPDFNENQDHVLFFGNEKYIESRGTVFGIAQRRGVADPAAILEEVLAGLAKFREFAESAAVPDANIAEIEKDFQRRARRAAHDTLGAPVNRAS